MKESIIALLDELSEKQLGGVFFLILVMLGE